MVPDDPLFARSRAAIAAGHALVDEAEWIQEHRREVCRDRRRMAADITNAAQAAGNTLWKRRQTEYPNFITFVVATTIGDRLAETEAALKDTKRLAERVSSEISARNP